MSSAMKREEIQQVWEKFRNGTIAPGTSVAVAQQLKADPKTTNDYLNVMQKIAKELKRRHPNIPLLVFPRGATYSLCALQQAGYDVVTMDTKTDRLKTRQILEQNAKEQLPPNGRVSGVQGNFDVALLQAGASTIEEVKAATLKMIKELGPQSLIANLGEGLTGKEDPVLVAAFIDAVHDVSELMIKNSK